MGWPNNLVAQEKALTLLVISFLVTTRTTTNNTTVTKFFSAPLRRALRMGSQSLSHQPQGRIIEYTFQETRVTEVKTGSTVLTG